MPETVSFGEKYIEQTLSRIGAKADKANELAEQAERLCRESRQLIANLQAEISDLYACLDEVVTSHSEIGMQGRQTEFGIAEFEKNNGRIELPPK